MRTCATCKWMSHPGVRARCEAPQNMEKPKAGARTGFDMEALPRWTFCTTQREDGIVSAILTNACGPWGRWWRAE